MPVAFDPHATADVWLDSDAEKPEAERPTFLARYMTCRERAEVRKIADDAFEQFKEGDEEATAATACRALKIAVTGWRNLPFEFSPDSFHAVLTPFEMLLLIWRVIAVTKFAEIDRKKSFAAQGSSKDTSANPVAAENAQTFQNQGKS